MEPFFAFEDKVNGNPLARLAVRMRPSNWDDFLGHVELIGDGQPLRSLITRK